MSLEDSLKDNEVLLTQVAVRDNQQSSQQLQLRFKGLSDVYVPYQHTYFSIPLSQTEAQDLIEQIQNPLINGQKNPFYGYQHTKTLVQGYFNIVQVTAPRTESKAFQRLRYKTRCGEFNLSSLKSKGKKLFRGGYFNRQARWNLQDEENYLLPGIIVETDNELITILEKKRQLDKLNSSLDKIRRHTKVGFKQGSYSGQWSNAVSRYKKLLKSDNSFNAKKSFQETKSFSYLNQETIELIEDINSYENSFETLIRGFGDLDYNYNSIKKKGTYGLFLNQRPTLKFKRQLTLDEWMNLKFMFFDIETPKFLENNYEVTQVAAILTENQQVKQRIVFNKQATKITEVKGHTIRSGYDTDRDMIGDISNWALQNDIEVISAYNINFDASMLKERGDLYVGEAEDEPKKDVTKKFFERFRMDGGFCVDLLRLGQTFLRGFANAKLENLSRFFGGMSGYRKTISYAEMAELQYLSEGIDVELSSSTKEKLETIPGNREVAAQRLILEYVCDDTEEMPKLLFGDSNKFQEKELTRNCLENLVWMAENFKLDFIKLLYSPTALRDVFDRGYFKHMGIQRDEIYPRGIKYFENEVNNNKNALKGFMNNLFGIESSNGTFHRVERRLIPVGFLLRHYLSKKTHSVRDFMGYVEERVQKGSHHEFVFLSHYVNGLADYMLTDFGSYLRTKKRYDQIFSKLTTEQPYKETVLGLNELFLHRYGRTRLGLQMANGVLGEVLSQGIYDREGNYRIVKAADIKHLKELNQFRSFVKNSGNNFLDMLLESNRLTTLELYKLFWTTFYLGSSTSKNFGNHLIHPASMAMHFENEAMAIKEDLNKYGEILSVNSPYVYFLPEKNESDFSKSVVNRVTNSKRVYCCPAQTVIEDLFIADKEYSKEDGFFKGVKIKDGPAYFSNAFYSNIYLNTLEHFWQEDYVSGIRGIISAFKDLKSKRIVTEDEKMNFLFFNKSKKCYFGFQDFEKYMFRLAEDEEEDKLPVHPISQFNPDYSMYLWDFSRKIKPFIKSLIPKVQENFSVDELRIIEQIVKIKKPKKPSLDDLPLFTGQGVSSGETVLNL